MAQAVATVGPGSPVRAEGPWGDYAKVFLTAGRLAAHAPPQRFCLSARVVGHRRKKPQRYTVAVFCGPDTRQRLLPLLPFGPDGVGSAAAVRLGKRLTRKGGKLSMVALAFQRHGSGGQQGRSVAHDHFHLAVAQPAKALQPLQLLYRVVEGPVCSKKYALSRKGV